MRPDPAATPFADGTICCYTDQSNLLIALLRVRLGSENDPRTQGFRLRGSGRSNELLKLLGFICREFYWIAGFGATHRCLPPTSSRRRIPSTVRPVQSVGWDTKTLILGSAHPHLGVHVSGVDVLILC